MIVFVDMVSGDQVLTDAYPQKPLVMIIGGVETEIPNVFMVQSRMVKKNAPTVNTGSNTSKQEEEELNEEINQNVCDLKDPELGFGFEGPQTYSESEFMVLYKSWCKSVKELIEINGLKPKEFMISAKAALSGIKENFSILEVYHTKSFNTDSFILGFWDEEANQLGSPKFIYFSQALNAIKY